MLLHFNLCEILFNFDPCNLVKVVLLINVLIACKMLTEKEKSGSLNVMHYIITPEHTFEMIINLGQ